MSFQSNSCFASRPKTAVFGGWKVPGAFWRLETQNQPWNPWKLMKLTVSLGRILFIYSIYIIYIYILHRIIIYVWYAGIQRTNHGGFPHADTKTSICEFPNLLVLLQWESLQGPYVALVRRKNDTLGPYHLPSHSLSVSCDKPRCFTQFKVRIIKGSSLLADKMLRWPIRSRWIIRDT